MLKIAMRFVLLSLCISCSSLPKKVCEQSSWNQVGYADGVRGRERSFDQHLRSCSTSETDTLRQTYDSGYQAGLNEYCTPRGAFEAGASGDAYLGLCPKEKEAEFLASYNKGYEVYRLLRTRASVDSQLTDLQRREERWWAHRRTISYQLLTDIHEQNLVERRNHLSQQINQAQQVAPPGQTSRFVDYQQSRQYRSGAFWGTLLGFGVGHAVQGRYEDTGWKYTASEAVAAAAVFGSSAVCDGRDTSCYRTIFPLGLVGLLTLKVFETIDLWGYTFSVKNGYVDGPY